MLQDRQDVNTDLRPGERIIVIKVRTLLAGVGLLLGSVAVALLLLRLIDILMLVVLAVLIGEVLEPLVALMEKARVPRVAGVLLLYASLLLALSAAGYFVLPGLIAQLVDLIDTIPLLTTQLLELAAPLLQQIQRAATALGLQFSLQSVIGNLAGQAREIATTLVSIPIFLVTIIFDTVLVIVMSIFWLLGKGKLAETIFSTLTPKEARLLDAMFRDMSHRVGAWMRGQIILSAAVGLMSYLALTVLGVNFSLLLAIFAGAMEFMPFVGPWIGGFPAVVVAFFQTPILGLEVTVAYVAIQQIENHILVPKILGQVVGLNPLVIIVVLLVGASLLGIMGAVVAVPVAAAIQVILIHLVILPLQKRAEAARGSQ